MEDSTGLNRILAIFLTVVISVLSFTWINEIDVFAADRDASITIYNQATAEYWYRITLEYDSEIYTPILVNSGTSSLGNQLYSMGSVVGTVVTIEGNMSWNFVEGQEVTWIWAFDSIVNATNKILHDDGTVMYDPSDYTHPTVSHEWLIADETLRLTTNAAGADIDSIGMIFYQWEDYDNGILAHQFGLTGEPNGNWDYPSSDGYIFDKDTTVDISLYDDGQLVDIIYYDVIRGINVETGALVTFDDDFIFNYFEDYIEIVSLDQSYENIRVAMTRVDLASPVQQGTDWNTQVEVMNLPYNEPANFVYQNDLQFGERYELTLFKKNIVGFYTEVLYSTIFEYGYTKSNANPSGYYTYNEAFKDVYGVELEDMQEVVKDMVSDSKEGIQAIGEVMAMLPYPFNTVTAWIAAAAILLMSIGVILWIIGK